MIDVFKRQVSLHSNDIAVQYEDDFLTYSQLDEASTRFANILMAKGIKNEAKIGVYLDRSLNMIMVILGILKSGAAYVPIDSSYPQDRIDYILDNSEAEIVITTKQLSKKVSKNKTDILIMENIEHILENTSAVLKSKVKIIPENLAYVIYTSGSTGRPKGVLVEHKNVIRLIQSTSKIYNFKHNDVWTMFHSYAFDYSIWEIWGALLNGAKLIVVPYMITRSPENFYELLVDEKVTILSQTPSAFRQLRKVDEKKRGKLSLRYITSGGEALDIGNLKQWFAMHGELKPTIINMYGITETTVHSTARVIREEDTQADNGSIIGQPLSDLVIYVLDDQLKPVPRGVVGEMYIGGQGVTRGYLNREDMTKERFIENPFHKSKFKVYKSGDLARINTSGELEYIGRADQQVKIRGFRVELEEIEAVISDSLQINEVVLSTVKDNGVNSLVAYLIPKSKDLFNLEKLKNEIKEKLPDYMVPSFFILVDNMPLTPNGKINKRKLPKPTRDNILTVSKNVLPNTETERELIGIWKEVLNVDKIGVTDDFFDLGGHSILAVKLTSLIKSKLGKNLPISVLFTDSTIRDLGKKIDSEANDYLKNPLVAIKSSGTKIPLFIIHPGMGQVMCFNDLVKNMDNSRPVFAVRAPGLYGECKPYNNVEKMARYYITLIKKRQPVGPYNLAGYCVGGSIAEEMVNQLRKSGEEVGSLSLLDIEPAHPYDHLNEEFIVSFFVEQFFKSFDVVNEEVKESVTVLTEAELKTKKFTHKQYIEYMLDVVKSLNIVDKEYTFDQMEYWYDTWKNTILAIDKHTANKIDVPITVYHAVEGEYTGDEWNGYSTAGVNRVDIKGDHYTMLKAPQVYELANSLSAKL